MKTKYFLFGKKTEISMFSYRAYEDHLDEYFERVWDFRQAHIIIVCFLADVSENLIDFERILNKTKAKVFLLSEEPLWDAFYLKELGRLDQRSSTVTIKDVTFEVNLINHLSSDVFEYSSFPHFLTTNKKYILNYINSLSNLQGIDEHNVFEKWKHKKYNFVSVNGNSIGKNCFKFNPSSQVPVISEQRSLLSQQVYNNLDNCFVFGNGWQHLECNSPYSRRRSKASHIKEMDLSSSIYSSPYSCFWHHEKLKFSRDNAKYLMSMENTVCKNYFTEKFFDGITTLSVPIFFKDNRKIYSNERVEGLYIDQYDIEHKRVSDLMLGFNIEKLLINNLNYAREIFSKNVFKIIDREISERCFRLSNFIKQGM